MLLIFPLVGLNSKEPDKAAYSNFFTLQQLPDFSFEALISAYPDFNFERAQGNLLFPDGTAIPFSDGLAKNRASFLESPDTFDMFFYRYPSRSYKNSGAFNFPGATITLPATIPFPVDPGRIRNENFFLRMYGSTEKIVRNRLAPVKFIPSAKGPTLWVTTVNGVNKAFKAVSDELDKIPKFRAFECAFLWRSHRYKRLKVQLLALRRPR